MSVAMFAPLSSEVLSNPYPHYARLMREEPVHWDETLAAWVLTSFADCHFVLQDHLRFSSDFRSIGESVPQEFLSLQTLDPPIHTRVRSILLPAFRAIDLSLWSERISDHGRKLLSRVNLENFDFVQDYCEPLTAGSMCILFGVEPLDDWTEFRRLQRDLILSMDSGLDPERGPAGMEARRALSRLVQEWVSTVPEQGLLRDIEFGGAQEHLPYVINSLRVLFMAGYSSTSSMIGNALRALLTANKGSIGGAAALTSVGLNELVRFDGAIQAESRATTMDVQLPSGHHLSQGEIVVVVLGSANRDPRVFEDPESLVLTRAPNPHLGFGHGLHSCMGSRLSTVAALRILNEVFAKYQVCATGEPTQRPSATLRGLDHLPISLSPLRP